MADKTIQVQIDEINRKLDSLLSFMQEEKMKRTSMEDLASDLSIIGKDMYDTAVAELENYSVELDLNVLKLFVIKLLKNIPTFTDMVSTIESLTDLARDAGPMVNEMIIDFTKQMNELDKKGYFDFFREIGPVFDNIIKGFSPEDLKELANNIVSILNIVKEMTQPEVLSTMQNAIKAFNSMETESVPSYSVWKLMREMNSPEIKKALGYGVTFMKNVSKDIEIEE